METLGVQLSIEGRITWSVSHSLLRLIRVQPVGPQAILASGISEGLRGRGIISDAAKEGLVGGEALPGFGDQNCNIGGRVGEPRLCPATSS